MNSTTLKKLLPIEMIEIHKLKPHEEIIQEHVEELVDDIQHDGFIQKPILVDQNSNVILDGHHRVTAAKKIGLKCVPCIKVDYYNEDLVSLSFWRSEYALSKEEVIQAGMRGKRFPHKTTRHIVHITCDCAPTPIADLS